MFLRSATNFVKEDGNVWRFTIFGVLFFLVLQLSLSFSPSTTQPHCAPVNPPPVSGTLVQPPTSRGVLFINEALLTPHSTWNCSEFNTYDTGHDSWIEIYNAQDQPFDLYSVHTTIDGGPNTNPFYLPFGSAIAPHGFLVVFPRMDANFSSTETATWRLLIGDIVVDEVKIPPMGEDQSYVRILDGGSSWTITSAPTIDSGNMASVVPPTATRTKAEATATARANRNNGGTSYGGGGSSSGGGSDGGNGDGSNGNSPATTHSKQIDGVQPTWNSLHHPDVVATAPSTVIQQAANIFPSGNTNELDVPRKLLLTQLVIALTLALLWCWKLFHTT